MRSDAIQTTGVNMTTIDMTELETVTGALDWGRLGTAALAGGAIGGVAGATYGVVSGLAVPVIGPAVFSVIGGVTGGFFGAVTGGYVELVDQLHST
jgi:phage tail tape-measure protein